MQRTVKIYKLTYATIEETANGLEIVNKVFATRATNSKDAITNANKNGFKGAKLLKEEIIEKLYVMDDETFFKYAKEVDG